MQESVFTVLQVLTVIFVMVAFALSLAHALELPGKMRLDRESYYAVQPIYYPGFTIGGISEPIAIILTIILLLLTPFAGAAFWLTLAALLGLLAQHIVFWFVTHPVNQFWVEGQNLNRLSAGFFGLAGKQLTLRTQRDPIGKSCVTAGSIHTWYVRRLRSRAWLPW